MDIGQVLGVFIAWPWLALLPAGLFGYAAWRRRRSVVLLAALCWLAYAPYEMGMKLRLLCSGECNIRVDLLLFYPALLAISLAAVLALARSK